MRRPLRQAGRSSSRPAWPDLGEIAEAVEAARGAGPAGLVLLHCVSGYPTPAEESNLRTIPHLAEAFDVLVGLSDHTLGISAAVATTALGAYLIEKHVTLSRAESGVDHAFSLEPHELKALVENTRVAYAALGHVDYALTESKKISMVFRPSLYVVKDVKKGEPLTTNNVRSIRPGYGLPPKEPPNVLGKCAARDLNRGKPLTHDMITT